MKDQDYKGKIYDLLRKDVSEEEKAGIRSSLEKSGLSPEAIDSLVSLGHLIEDMPVARPSQTMDRRFYAMLEDEQRKILLGKPETDRPSYLAGLFSRTAFRVAAGIALFLIGWFSSGWLGNSLQDKSEVTKLADEVKGLRETLVLTMMQQNSSTERIKAVTMASEFGSADDQIIESLFDLLNHDSSDNVRLLALDALTRYASGPDIRERLVKSIGSQTSPMIQLRFTEIMLALNEKGAVPEFRKILGNANLNYSVRGKMKEAITILL